MPRKFIHYLSYFVNFYLSYLSSTFCLKHSQPFDNLKYE